jgi:hypothetical protein
VKLALARTKAKTTMGSIGILLANRCVGWQSFYECHVPSLLGYLDCQAIPTYRLVGQGRAGLS